MAGMALLLVFAVMQDESGWTVSDRDGQRMTQPGRMDLPDALPSTLQNQPPAAAAFLGDQSWAEFADALSRPIDRGAPSSDSYTGLRRAQGVDRPPQPPSFGPPPRGRVREWLDDDPNRRQSDAARFRSEFNEPVPRVDPRDVTRPPRGRRANRDDGLIDVPDLEPTPRRERDLLYEQRLADNRDDRRYLVPPSREFDDRRSGVTPVPYSDRDEFPRRDQATNDLPPVDLPLNSPNNFDDAPTEEQPIVDVPSPSEGQDRDPSSSDPTGGTNVEDNAGDSSEPQRSSWPLIWAMVGLFGSVGFNVYLGWIAWDIHGRYQDVVDEVRELENRFDPRQPGATNLRAPDESEPSSCVGRSPAV